MPGSWSPPTGTGRHGKATLWFVTTRYALKSVLIELPRYDGTGENIPAPRRENEIEGRGWAEIDGSTVIISLHPDGRATAAEPGENHRYLLADITSWYQAGASVAFGVSKAGPFDSYAARSRNHGCSMRCKNAKAAEHLTAEARAAGLTAGDGRGQALQHTRSSTGLAPDVAHAIRAPGSSTSQVNRESAPRDSDWPKTPLRVPRRPPRTWWEMHQTKAAIRKAGSWPSQSITISRYPHVIDVDQYGGDAVVMSICSTDKRRQQRDGVTFLPTGHRDIFRRERFGWTYQGGGGGGGADSLTARQSLSAGGNLKITGHGGSDRLHYLTLVCPPDVAAVEVRRSEGTRRADVEHGPGYLVVLLPKDQHTEVVTFDSAGHQIHRFIPQLEQFNPRAGWIQPRELHHRAIRHTQRRAR